MNGKESNTKQILFNELQKQFNEDGNSGIESPFKILHDVLSYILDQ
jgi:hypothetical protein